MCCSDAAAVGARSNHAGVPVQLYCELARSRQAEIFELGETGFVVCPRKGPGPLVRDPLLLEGVRFVLVWKLADIGTSKSGSQVLRAKKRP